jgi:hypothetical protein
MKTLHSTQQFNQLLSAAFWAELVIAAVINREGSAVESYMVLLR